MESFNSSCEFSSGGAAAYWPRALRSVLTTAKEQSLTGNLHLESLKGVL